MDEEALIDVDALLITERIKEKLTQISPEATLSYGTFRIYKVPEKYRNKNPEAYTPRQVSIGLVHHGEAQLQAMEEYKLKYLNNFLDTFQVPLNKLVEYVNGDEGKLVCGCYEDIYVQNVVQKYKFATTEVILLDGIFVLELFLKNYFVKLREKGDVVFDNSTVSNEILHDLLLLENQLPYKFLSRLYDEFVGKKVGKVVLDDILCSPSFNELAHVYFRGVGNAGKLLLRSIDFQHTKHFVEFLSMLHMPDDEYEGQKKMNKETNAGKDSHFSKCPNATKLKEVGVKFRAGTTSCLLNIIFKDGVLTIPPLTVNGSTEIFFRNLIAFEQSGYHFKYTTSFAILLDNLIDTAKDVDILIEKGIINNELASSQQVADIFNTLYKEFLAYPKEFYYVEECRRLNDYSRDPLHLIAATFAGWGVFIWGKYFRTPWSFCSLLAAVILLVLTIVQTSYAIKTYKRGH